MEQTYRVQCTPAGHAIVRPDGRIMRPRFKSRDQALTRIEKLIAEDAKSGHKTRPCITCRQSFLSEGAHHRMCTGCRHRSSDAPFEIGHRRSRIGNRG